MPSARLALLALLAMPAIAAAAPMPVPGAADISRIAAGRYAADPQHTQVAWSLDHLGFTTYSGLFGGVTGTLTLDPARPAAATLAISVPVAGVVTTVPALDTHLKSADFFDAATYPTVTFAATGVRVSGDRAKIAGTLTLHGVSRPVVLDARFVGAGVNPLSKKATIGFDATTTLKRSDFGMTFLLPALGDTVDLTVHAAFEKVE